MDDEALDDAGDEAAYDVYEEDPDQTPEERAELHRTLMVEIRQRLADVDEGREVPILWDDEANRLMFGEDS